MKRSGLALLLLASCGHAPAPPRPTPVVQRPLRDAPMLFHPELPIVAQEAGARCDVWDLSTTLYRGTVSVEECRGWARPRPAPADLAAATPEEPIDADVRGQDPCAGGLVWAASQDGRWVATARRRGRVARVWDARTRALVRALSVDPEVHPRGARIADLMWTRSGQLVAAAFDDGPRVWDPRDPKPGFVTPQGRGPERYESFSVDPAGRYLGFQGSGYRKPYEFASSGVIAFRVKGPQQLLFVERAVSGLRLGPVAWAAARPAAFFVETRASGSLEMCGRESRTILALDPERGVRRRDVDPTRALTLLEPSPDGRFVLLGSDDGPPLDRCEEEPPTSSDRGPVLRLWEPETDRQRDLFSTPIGAVAWAPAGGRFAVATGGLVHVFEGEEARPVASWEGSAPLLFTADGGALAFGAPRGLGIRAIDGGAETWLDEPGVTAVALGPGGRVALGTDTRIALWSLDPPSRRALADVRGTRRIAWSPAGEAVLLWTRVHRAYLHRFEWPMPIELPGAGAADLLGWGEGGVVLARGPGGVRRLRWEGRWRELPERPLEPSFVVDPSARWAAAPPDPDGWGGEYQIQRLADEGTLLLSDGRERYAFSSDGDFTVAPPGDLAFRLGADVLRAPMVRAEEATFASPVPRSSASASSAASTGLSAGETR